jgi:hypothetical protein
MELNWTRNSKSKMEMNWLPIRILLFGCAWNLLFETKGVSNYISCLDVLTMEFEVLLNLEGPGRVRPGKVQGSGRRSPTSDVRLPPPFPYPGSSRVWGQGCGVADGVAGLLGGGGEWEGDTERQRGGRG